MKLRSYYVGGPLGAAVTVGLAHVGLPFETVAIGAGATVTALTLFLRRGGRKQYALAGTIFTLLLAAVFYATSSFPDAYHQDVATAALGLGIVSGVIVTVQRAGEQAVKRLVGGKTGEESATAIYNAVAAVLGLIGMIWAVLTAYEKAVRYGSVGVGGSTALLLNVVGARFPVPIWFIDGGVDASIVLFIGCTLIGFHTLETIHTTWHATKATASAAAGAGKKGVQKVRSEGESG